MEKNKFASRLGFILTSAGCAIGLGNVWRFPYICGKYGGAAFIIIYLIFLVIFGIPVMTMEFAVGRGSGKSIAEGFKVLEPEGKKWHLMKYLGIIANVMLMMYYVVIAGWMVLYLKKFICGEFDGMAATDIESSFGGLMGDTFTQILMIVIVVLLGIVVCALGIQNGVEKVTKVMMTLLLVAMIVLVVRVALLPGASEGVKYYLVPDFAKIKEAGFSEVIFAAMGQAFFTLSIGIGSMQIFGAYIGKDRSLFGEAAIITGLDTLVAVMAGFIVIPSCFAFGIDPTAGPPLIFITLPNVFNSMAGGRIWGSLFFLFMVFAAMSTVIAVFENIISIFSETFKWDRKKACTIALFVLIILAIPCALGYGVWSNFKPIGGDIQGFEDFIVSNNLLPIGALVYTLFCTWNFGWGWDKFTLEANEGNGPKVANWMKPYCKYVLPLLIIYVFIAGYISFF